MQGNTFLNEAKKAPFKALYITCIMEMEILFTCMSILMVICRSLGSVGSNCLESAKPRALVVHPRVCENKSLRFIHAFMI